VIQVLLQVLDDGRLTDGRGRSVVLENTVIVMTSNLGADLRELGARKRPVGFGAVAEEPVVGDVTDRIREAARASLPPELWNRIDEPLVFEPLARDQIAAIAALMIDGISSQLEREHGITLELGPGAAAALIDAGGFDAELGARPMRRTIQRLIEGPVARMVLADEIRTGSCVKIVGKDAGDLAFEID
jgi:ATP-dependent Clp protease ATP-binding subunit ClpA